MLNAASFLRASAFIGCTLTFLTLAACEGPVPDGGPEPSTPTPENDGGEPEGTDGGDGPVDGGQDAGPPPLEETAQRLCLTFIRGEAQAAADAALRIDARCSATDPLPNIGPLEDADVVDVSRCLPGRADHQVFLDALEGGRVAFDLDALESCAQSGRNARAQNADLDALDARQAALAAALTTCTDVITPLAQEGDTCTQAWDCPASAPCQADPRDTQAFACLAPAAEGEACLDRPLAAPDGLLRAPLRLCGDALQCFNEVCTARLPLGAYCDATTPACSEDLVCGPGNFCVNPVAQGGACTNDSQCEADLRCAPGQGPTVDGGPGEGPSCQPQVEANTIADGEACTLPARCRSLCSVCRPDAPLSPSFSCQDRGSAGDACGVTSDCRRGLYCTAEGSCAALRGVTEPCDADNPCADTLFCNPNVSACQLRPALGNPCSPFGPDLCAEGFCVNNVCAAGVGGDPCTGDSTCASGFVCVNTPVPDVDGGPQPSNRICVALPREGAPCTIDGRCVANAYCDGERCRAFPGPGETCRNGSCAPGAFCNGETPDATCELARPPSSLCTADGQCASNVCLDTGTCAALAPKVNTNASLFVHYVLLSLLPFGLIPLALARRHRRRRNAQTEPEAS